MEMAEALVTKVLLGMAMFPAVVRSDNAAEFVGAVIEEMNKLLEIKHYWFILPPTITRHC